MICYKNINGLLFGCKSHIKEKKMICAHCGFNVKDGA